MVERVTTNIEDPGIGFVSSTGRPYLFIGSCSAGTANTLYRVAGGSTVLGQGPLAEALAYANTVAPGPHYGIRATTSVAAANTAVAPAATGPLVTVAGTANDTYDVRLEVTTGGILGVGRFKFTLDGGKNYSAIKTIPSGGTYLIPDTGLTLTFAAGTYVATEFYTFQTTASYMSAANIDTAIDAALLAARDFVAVVLVGDPADSAAGATIAASLQTKLTALAGQKVWTRGIFGTGPDTPATVLASFAAVSGERLSGAYGWARVPSGKKIPGWGSPAMSSPVAYAARCAGALVSENPGRVKSGQLLGVTEVEHDEEREPSGFDAANIVTYSSVPFKAGYFIRQGHLMAQDGSDFQRWELGMLMDEACRVVARIMVDEINEKRPTVAGGAIAPEAAAAIDGLLNNALKVRFRDELDAAGQRGHVSAINAAVDRTNNYLSTGTLNVRTLVRPDANTDAVVHTIGFTSGSVTGEAEAEPEEDSEAV